MPPNDRITILLVDDHAIVRDGLRQMLEAQNDMVVVGEAGDSAEAARLAGERQPDIVLLDIEIPGQDVTVTVKRIHALTPPPKVIILSMYDGPHLVRQLLDLGIRGYLLKSVHRPELLAAIRTVHTEPDRAVLAISRKSIAQAQAGTETLLSYRERQVLELAAQALSNTQIATRLNITEPTVKRHLRNIFAKLGAVSRIDAVNKAAEASMLSERPMRRPQD
jgi:DNA-binding NarL/FixJ family response regulator